MNQYNWIYLSDHGKRHNVGLMHGPESGHFLVHCNSKIILIDFHVLEDKTYSVFIEDQLCEIVVERKGEDFFYRFNLNKDADTPLNRMRKKRDKKYFLQSLMVLGGLIVVVTIFVLGLMRFSSMQDKVVLAEELETRGRETKARVLIKMEESHQLITYFFIVNGKAYSIEKEVKDLDPIILDNGMPLEEGDEFVVRYIPNNPKQHLLDYSQPTTAQLDIYRDRAAQRYVDENPESSPARAQCLAKIAYALKGIDGYADFYFQNTPAYHNTTHNNRSYTALIDDSDFKAMAKQQCASIQ